ncbi:MAG: PilZ domain-containing protein [Desulfobacterales bacterium]
MMEQATPNDPETGNRQEPRKVVDKYYSVEFSIEALEPVYQFRIWNLSEKGMCVLVREDSAVLHHLQKGKIFKMKYYPTDFPGQVEQLETEVRHVSKDDKGRFKGHFMVGLAILEK